eukprot:g3192.t1
MADQKRTLFVGGLNEEVDETFLGAAFSPFGEIKRVQLPKDSSSGKHKGFGFVVFSDADDAEDAIDNMHNAELHGRVLTVNLAKPQTVKLGLNRSVWEEADAFYGNLKSDGDDVDPTSTSAPPAEVPPNTK